MAPADLQKFAGGNTKDPPRFFELTLETAKHLKKDRFLSKETNVILDKTLRTNKTLCTKALCRVVGEYTSEGSIKIPDTCRQFMNQFFKDGSPLQAYHQKLISQYLAAESKKKSVKPMWFPEKKPSSPFDVEFAVGGRARIKCGNGIYQKVELKQRRTKRVGKKRLPQKQWKVKPDRSKLTRWVPEAKLHVLDTLDELQRLGYR